MDGSTLEHSDSDSGESWTILESSPSYADDAPDEDAVDPSLIVGFTLESADKDDDTDGISIISDSDPESVAAGECRVCDDDREPCDQPLLPAAPAPPPRRPADPLPDTLLADPAPPNSHPNHDESIRDEDFLGDNTGKLKTYVHRRNKRLSAVLNIIVLGSVITAAGVAIGHMWGVRHDCGAQHVGQASAAAVNKILSNLYRLQEENAALRARLRELQAAGAAPRVPNAAPPGAHAARGPRDNAKHKCKKLFEESLTSKNADKLTKCVDDDTGDRLAGYLTPEHEREFLHDIDKLKHVYQQNRSWLDEEVAKRLKQEARNVKDMKNKLKSPKSLKLNEEFNRKNENLKRQLASEPPAGAETVINVTEPLKQPQPRIMEIVEPAARVSYADSLKSSHKVVKRAAPRAADALFAAPRDRLKKKKPRKEFDTISENSLGEEMSMKDDRYVAPKYKPERKKNDRQKLHKKQKQKRRNKYEQWEMKGGYLKDYDDVSAPSLEEYALKSTDRNRPARDFERNNYMTQFAELIEKKSTDSKESADKTEANNETVKRDKDQDNWYEKRAALRSEARKRLELEMFGENSPSAQWYFRRARRRQHCRAPPPPPANHTRRTATAAASARPRRPAAPTRDNYKTKH